MDDNRFNEKYFLTDEQVMLRESAREFAEREIAPRAKELDTHGVKFPSDLLKKAGDLGFCGLLAPESCGGMNMDSICQMVVIEELTKVSPGFAAIVHSTSGLGLESFLIGGTEEQKQKWAHMAISGERFCSFALTEPQGGSDAGGLTTSARFDEETREWVINGQKSWITGIESGGFFVVAARTDPESVGGHGISVFVVDSDTPGLTISDPEHKLGARCSSSGSLFFNECRLPEDALIGEKDQGFKIMMKGLDMGRLGIAAISIGIAQRAYELAVDYANQRVAFGKPIACYQGVSFPIAEMGMKIDLARTMLYHACRMKDAGLNYSAEAAAVKIFASEACVEISEKAIQIYGGAGYSDDCEVSCLWRESKLQTIGEGTSEILRIVLSRAALKGNY